MSINDFTKEELEKINEVLERDSWELFEELQTKIQSMIDTYCEHDNSGSVGLHNLCNKCGHIS